MDDRKALLDQVLSAYAARDRGELDDVMAAFHAEAAFTLAGDRECGGVAGNCNGHAQIKDSMAQLIAGFQFSDRKILSTLVDGDRVAVHSRVTIRGGPKNLERETEMLDLFTMRDGKIVELTEFADTALAAMMMA